jgi:alcohol dehydrogenase (cytochrome c)
MALSGAFIQAACSRSIGYLYKPMIDRPANFRTGSDVNKGLPGWDYEVEIPCHPQGGAIEAFEPDDGGRASEWKNGVPVAASVLSVSGNLVFAGEPDGYINAWNARTGELFWRHHTRSSIHGSPVTYSVNGKQYFAAPSGCGDWVAGIAPNMVGAPRDNALVVFPRSIGEFHGYAT